MLTPPLGPEGGDYKPLKLLLISNRWRSGQVCGRGRCVVSKSHSVANVPILKLVTQVHVCMCGCGGYMYVFGHRDVGSRSHR